MPDETDTDAQPGKRRLFVGGLHKEVTRNELQERFGRFGHIASVDIRTKRDIEGEITNVFAYMDIDISQANFKKCLSVYNDTKWKGRTVKIQVAKENFLDKLAQERQEAEEISRQPVSPAPAVRSRKALEQEAAEARLQENLKSAGVEDFVKRKAVPGTPIPGEPGWVVAKFGRVLPIMHMQRRDRRAPVTYDPSKYVHHVRKFKEDEAGDRRMSALSLESLTWCLDETESARTSAMDRKRMGQFPDSAKKKKKKKKEVTIFGEADSEMFRWIRSGVGSASQTADQDFEVVPSRDNRNGAGQGSESVKLQPYSALAQTGDNLVQGWGSVDDLLRECSQEEEAEDSCGSADTDDICFSASRPETVENQAGLSWAQDYYNKERIAAMAGDAEDNQHGFGTDNASTWNADRLPRVRPASEASAGATVNLERKDLSGTGTRSSSEHDSRGKGSLPEVPVDSDLSEAASEEERGEPDGDEDDVTRHAKVGTTGMPRTFDREANGLTRGLCTADSNEDQAKFEAGDYHGSSEDENEGSSENGDDDDQEDASATASEDDWNAPNHAQVPSDRDSEDSEENSQEDSELDSKESGEASEEESNDGEEDSVVDNENSEDSGENSKNSRENSKDSEDESKSGEENSEDSENSQEDSSEDPPSTTEESEEEADSPPGNSASGRATASGQHPPTAGINAAGSQRKPQLSDRVRLESVKKKQVDFVTQRAAVQEALRSVDLKGSSGAGTHVRFDSESEDSDTGDRSKEKAVRLKEKPSRKLGLFGEDDAEEAEMLGDSDDYRFKIKPQFQGKAGEKLLKLQDRIGMDDRFKLGEMFQEEEDGSEEEEEEADGRSDVEEEKQAALSVLAGIVGNQAMQSVRSKTIANFRDPSHVRYDPTRQEHAHFELAETSERTASGRKDRPSADLPEVSKEVYHQVGDLAFRQDEEAGQSFRFFPEEEEQEAEQASGEGHRFGSLQKDILAATTLGRRQWKLDSSESEAEEEKEDEARVGSEDEERGGGDDVAMDTTPGNRPALGGRAFFFAHDDVRLKSGAELFCRKLSSEGMNQWFQEQKTQLQGDFKKRHQRAIRDAKKAAQQSSKKPRK